MRQTMSIEYKDDSPSYAADIAARVNFFIIGSPSEMCNIVNI